MILSLPGTLTDQLLEQTIQEQLDEPLSAGALSAALSVSFVLDLRLLEFADFAVLAKLLLLTDWAGRLGARIRIEMPQPESWLPTDSRRAEVVGRRRASCLRFLVLSGFTRAARLPHQPACDVELRGLSGSTGGAAPAATGVSSAPERRDEAPTRQRMPEADGAQEGGAKDELVHVDESGRMLSFRWIAPDAAANLRRSDALAATARGLSEMGLSRRDARLLTDAVVYELVENVALHAGSDGDAPHALVGAILIDEGAVPPFAGRSELRAFAEWAVDSRSPLLWMIIGDSGVGLVDRLRPYLPTVTAQPVTGAGGDPLSTEEQVTLWALTRWSTSGLEMPRTPRGTGGLWRVQRVVRSFGGGVLIRSASALAGFAFGHSASDEVVHWPTNAYLPGTLVDVFILPHAVRHVPAVLPPTTSDALDLTWVRVPANSVDDERSFQRALELAHAGGDILLSVDGGPGPQITHGGLVHVLTMAAEMANPSVVVAVVAGVHTFVLGSAVDALHHRPPENGDDARHDLDSEVGDPFLLIDEMGHGRWCGGNTEVRDLLDELLAADGVSLSDPDTRMRFGDLLVDHPHLVVHDGEMLRTTIRPADVIAELSTHAEERLAAAVEGTGRGVIRGSYRTPNLRLADRWVYVDQVVEDAVGSGTAAFLLAQALAARVPGGLPLDTEIVQISSVIQDLAHTFVECVGIHGKVHAMTDEFSPPGRVEQIKPGTPVILCADILLTENSVRRVLAALLSWDAVPVAVIAPFDARDDDGPIEIFGVVVPVIRLARVVFGVPDPSAVEVIDIDPVLRAPVLDKPSRVPSRYVWDPHEFLTACAEIPHVIGLGHVERPANRHFTVYFDASRIIEAGGAMRDLVADKLLGAITGRLTQTDDPELPPADAAEAPIVVCNPGPADGYAGRLASLVAQGLGAWRGGAEPVQIIRVPRVVTGSRYAFPEALDRLPLGADVILVDWGSFDAATVLQLMRLAAEGGARRVLGLILLSQLPAHEERALTMIRSVGVGPREDDASDPDRRPQRAVPATVQFVTSLGITPMAASECSFCRFIAQLQEDADSGIPEPVAQHARRISELLQGIGRDESVRRSRDAFGHPIQVEDGIAYLELRTMLLASLRSTGEAQRVADILAGAVAANDLQRQHAVVRLLAAERQWLGLPPLRLQQCAASVANVAAAVALDMTAPDALRMQALIVLTAAVPDELTRILPRLWRSMAGSVELLLHLLYHVYRIVRHRHGNTVFSLEMLRANLDLCAKVEAEAYASVVDADDMSWLLQMTAFEVDRRSVEHEQLTIPQAWARLQSHYIFRLRRHPYAAGAATRMRLILDDPPVDDETLDNEVWSVLDRSWKAIEVFLQTHLLPYLPALMPVLEGAFAEEHFTAAHRISLERLASFEATKDITDMSEQVRALRGRGPLDRGQLNRDWAGTWHGLSEGLRGLQEMVMAAGGAGLDMAVLAAFIEACPTALGRVIADCIAETRSRHLLIEINTIDVEPEVRVFCHQDLLAYAIMQLIENVDKHRLPEYADRSVKLTIGLEVNSDTVVVSFRNTGTARTDAPGHGLNAIKRKLRAFGAGLEELDPIDEGVTYEVELRLLRWTQP